MVIGRSPFCTGILYSRNCDLSRYSQTSEVSETSEVWSAEAYCADVTAWARSVLEESLKFALSSDI
ncbi:hypothetical protein DIM_02250 [Candidatus Denitrolinea symbiosum]|nr:hypothetical protein DIM_02250 [Candidatus Denitrolinea symbiosum]